MSDFSTIHSLANDELATTQYDILLVALGFESRATAVASKASNDIRVRLAIGFDHNQVVAYEKNCTWFHENGFTAVRSLSNSDMGNAVRTALSPILAAAGEDKVVRILIDISCFDRFRLAELVDTLRQASVSHRLCVHYWYCIAKFDPPRSAAGRNEVAGPIHRRFAGRFTDPGRPLALVAGLGYEIGKVMGAAEYLQASKVIALFPESPIKEYESEVTIANKLLLDDLEKRDVIPYSVSDPRRTVATLDSIVRGLQDNHNVVLLPGGPKIFVLACLTVQSLHREVSVWRVSSGSSISPRDVLPSEHFIGLGWTNAPRDSNTH
ncbi:MAG: hypothetical protein JWN23_937 [Rhodocyclales bacterium]|nr:hypothetical protein [Rhodocyclales bacterium]